MQESETLRKDGGALSNKRPPRILVVDDDSRFTRFCFVNSLQITVSTYLWQKMPNR